MIITFNIYSPLSSKRWSFNHLFKKQQQNSALQLGTKGDIGFNVIDNLLVVHSPASKTSFIFDVKAAPTAGGAKGPVVPPLPVASSLKHHHGSSEEPPGEAPTCLFHIFSFWSSFWFHEALTIPPSLLDARDWMNFYPDFIVSPQLGYLWTISIHLVWISSLFNRTKVSPHFETHPLFQDHVMDAFTDKSALLDFLLRRRDSRTLILKFFQATLESKESPSIVAGLFDQLNVVCSTLAPEQWVLQSHPAASLSPNF